MPGFDDRLTRELDRAAHPGDPAGVFERMELRRHRRASLRRIQAAFLAVAVLVGTAAGFVALRAAFDPDRTPPGVTPTPTGLPENGEIVFAREGDDGRFHLFAAQADGSGERQITDDATNDTDPAVSPDGKTIAYVHELDQGVRVIATVPIEGGTTTWLTVEEARAHDPAWSPDGTQIAFVGASDFEGFPVEDSVVYVLRLERQQPRALLHNTAIAFADPSWSPDGNLLAVAARDLVEGNDVSDHWMITEIGVEDPPQPRLGLTDVDERAPAWSPDGTHLAFIREGADGDEVWTRSRGGSETPIATGVRASLEPDLAWAPDGSALLVSDGDWIYRMDSTPEGDPSDNFVQLFRGVAPSWQPVPAPSSPSVAPSPETSPSPSPTPEPIGHDIGLEFRLCHLHPLGGIDFLGDGTSGKAWTGSPVTSEGRCSSRLDAKHLLAVDVTGDGVADAASEPFEFCQFCRPFAALDFDADGDDELAVLIDGGTVSSFLVYSASVADGKPSVAPLLIAPPGHPAAGDDPGEPFTISSGGDEGYSAWVRCEGFPTAPVLVNTWRDARIDGDTMEVHETAFVLLEDGRFHVVDTTDYEAPVSDPIPNVSDAPACGVDWQIWS